MRGHEALAVRRGPVSRDDERRRVPPHARALRLDGILTERDEVDVDASRFGRRHGAVVVEIVAHEVREPNGRAAHAALVRAIVALERECDRPIRGVEIGVVGREVARPPHTVVERGPDRVESARALDDERAQVRAELRTEFEPRGVVDERATLGEPARRPQERVTRVVADERVEVVAQVDARAPQRGDPRLQIRFELDVEDVERPTRAEKFVERRGRGARFGGQSIESVVDGLHGAHKMQHERSIGERRVSCSRACVGLH